MVKLVEAANGQSARGGDLVDADCRVHSAAFQYGHGALHCLHGNLLSFGRVEAHLDATLHHRVDEAHYVGNAAAGEHIACGHLLLLAHFDLADQFQQLFHLGC